MSNPIAQGRDALPADLIARLEGAPADDERKLIIEAIEFAYESGWLSPAAVGRCRVLLSVGAYLDAAMSLVPEGWGLELHVSASGGQRGWAYLFCDGGAKAQGGRSTTPALALCAAALRARSAS